MAMSKKNHQAEHIVDALELLESGMSEQEIVARFERTESQHLSSYIRLVRGLMRERLTDVPPQSLLTRILAQLPTVSEPSSAMRAATTGIKLPEKTNSSPVPPHSPQAGRVYRAANVLSPYWRYLVPVVGVMVVVLVLQLQGEKGSLSIVTPSPELSTESNPTVMDAAEGAPAAKALQFARTAVETVSPNQVVEVLISQVTTEAAAYSEEDTDVLDTDVDVSTYVPAITKPYENIQ